MMVTMLQQEFPSTRTTAQADIASRVPSPLTAAFVTPMTFEEFTNSTIFKDADFATKISLISSLYGVVSAWKYFTMVNKMENDGGASEGATSSLPANLQNGAVATASGGMINLNQEPQRKRGFEMDALLEQNSEIDALEAEFLKKRRAHQELLKAMIAKVDAQLEFDEAMEINNNYITYISSV